MSPLPAPRDRRALSNFKHGLTGEIILLSQAEQVAYDDLCREIHQSLAPQTALERPLTQSICDDRWRLRRACTLESSMFAEGVALFASSEEATGDPDVDFALSQAHTWIAQAKNLNLLSLYEGRAQRRFEKNMAELRRLRQERQAALDAAIEEAALLAHHAQNKGEAYDITEPFRRREFEFSTVEIRRMLDRWHRLIEAKKFAEEEKKLAKQAKKFTRPPQNPMPQSEITARQAA
jgi:hypothetical protein